MGTKIDPRQALVCRRAAKWCRREQKWHRKLEVERGWDWSGSAIGAPVAAVGALLVALGAPVYVGLLGAVIIGLVQWRGGAARGRLRDADYPRAWQNADRIAEMYESLIARIEAGADPGAMLRISDGIEAAARGSLPNELAAALVAEDEETERGE